MLGAVGKVDEISSLLVVEEGKSQSEDTASLSCLVRRYA